MSLQKLKAGSTFPSIKVPKLGGGEVDLAEKSGGHDWKMVVVYRGKHCPICTRYLGELNEALPKFNELGVDVVAVSADSEERATAQIAEVTPDFPVGYDLSLEQMDQLGLYVSDPRSEKESDRPFAEPGLFVVNGEGKAQIIDISNAPFARPAIETLIKGITFVKNPENNYPVRGMRA